MNHATLHHVILEGWKLISRRRIGHSKVFFRAGVLGYLEEVRDDIVIKLTRWLQGACWGHLRRKDFAKRKRQRDLIVVVQRNFRKFLTLRHWPWFMLIQKTKPLIGMVNIEEEIREGAFDTVLWSFRDPFGELKSVQQWILPQS